MYFMQCHTGSDGDRLQLLHKLKLHADLPWIWISIDMSMDLIFCYKIVFGLVSVNFNDFFLSTVLLQLLVDMHINCLNLDVPVVCGKIFLLSVL